MHEKILTWISWILSINIRNFSWIPIPKFWYFRVVVFEWSFCFYIAPVKCPLFRIVLKWWTQQPNAVSHVKHKSLSSFPFLFLPLILPDYWNRGIFPNFGFCGFLRCNSHNTTFRLAMTHCLPLIKHDFLSSKSGMNSLRQVSEGALSKWLLCLERIRGT